MIINLIGAAGKRGQIGRNGFLPWQNRHDMTWFRDTTLGGILIIGYRTYLETGDQLASRIIKIHERGRTPESVLNEVDRQYPRWPVWIAGGAATYRAFAPFVDGLKLISAIDYDNDPADDKIHTFFPFDAYGINWGFNG